MGMGIFDKLTGKKNSGNLSSEKKVIGVYGSKGKTVVTELMSYLLNNSGLGAGYISSTGNLINQRNDNYLSSDVISQNELLDLLHTDTSKYFVVEIHDSGLRQGVYQDIFFDGMIIPNVHAQSNLDQMYAITALLKDGGILLGNGLDNNLRNWIFTNRERIPKPLYLGMVNQGDFKILQRSLKEGTKYMFRDNQYLTPNPATYAVVNKVLSSTMAEALSGVPELTRYTQGFKTTRGRFDIFHIKDRTVVIDNAKTPEALESALSEITALKPIGKKVVTVLGLSGDYLNFGMPDVAQKYSSLVLLTPFATRKFRNYDINSAVFTHNANGKRFVAVERVSSDQEFKALNRDNLMSRINRVISTGDSPFIAFDADDYSSRLNAIEFAMEYADPGDIVYISGKGDEDFINYNDVEFTWSDHEAVKMASDNVN
jgi:UDP-N-acetylmuramoyl-L-alanyl-D-glutamate--2,6-diaminopimelate ligase